MQGIRAPAATEMAMIIKQCICKLETEEALGWSVERLSAEVVNFYKEVEECMQESQTWADVPAHVHEEVISGAERHVMTHLYDRCFRANADDEVKDLQLQERIRSLRWITPLHLEACFVGENQVGWALGWQLPSPHTCPLSAQRPADAPVPLVAMVFCFCI